MERKEERKPFVFDEHIQPMTPEIILNYLMSKKRNQLKALIPSQRRRLEKKAADETVRLNTHFDFVRNFFRGMELSKYCNAEYYFHPNGYHESYEKHKILIHSSKEEVFQINGDSNTFKDGKTTSIPVRKHNEEFNLEVFDLPPQTDIPLFGNLRVFYRFNTEIDLNRLFTKDPLKEYIRKEDLMYGSPGKLIYRINDGFYEQVRNKIIAPSFMFNNKRKDVNLQGRLYIGERFFYRGRFDSTGNFPFFIIKNKGDGEDEKPETPVPREKIGA